MLALEQAFWFWYWVGMATFWYGRLRSWRTLSDYSKVESLMLCPFYAFIGPFNIILYRPR